jgi:hypothetical protein
MNDVVANKVQSIQRCVRRARDEYAADPAGVATDFTRQDAAIASTFGITVATPDDTLRALAIDRLSS